ncbi:MAG TPA: type II toxin-antitoxin system CcdA family antitoxin [Steroidobacteraceae bacterium]|nr:type II toxin-antitoxin system CcdA family antitoxin [Steroidobacteraceae bacterium]
MQLLDMMENPRPRSAKFNEAMAWYQKMKAEQWQQENAEAIRSSNEYVEKHGLPLAKYRMPPKSEEAEHGDE